MVTVAHPTAPGPPAVPGAHAAPGSPAVPEAHPVPGAHAAPGPPAVPEAHPVPGTRRLPSLRQLGPNWYATVMGTAIVATAGAGLPVDVPGLRVVWVAVWGLSAMLLAVVSAARAGHWLHHRDQARAHLLDPAVAPFYGCPPMALLAVGAATLVVGGDVLGDRAASAVGAVLFGAGTVLGLAVAVTIPYLMVVRHRPGPSDASPVWLLPVVTPMVSAAVGPLLVPYLPVGQGRTALLLGCYALFGLSLLATLMILPLVFARLLLHGPLPLAPTPVLFLVLGPLGQSTTAVGQLAKVAPSAAGAPYGATLGAFAVLYGVPVMGFALLWLALSAALVVRGMRRGMRFSMTWWAFTFPVGTCVTGTAGLARHTGLVALEWSAVGLFALLVTAWAVAGWGTLRGLFGGGLPGAGPQRRSKVASMSSATATTRMRVPGRVARHRCRTPPVRYSVSPRSSR